MSGILKFPDFSLTLSVFPDFPWLTQNSLTFPDRRNTACRSGVVCSELPAKTMSLVCDYSLSITRQKHLPMLSSWRNLKMKCICSAEQYLSHLSATASCQLTSPVILGIHRRYTSCCILICHRQQCKLIIVQAVWYMMVRNEICGHGVTASQRSMMRNNNICQKPNSLAWKMWNTTAIWMMSKPLSHSQHWVSFTDCKCKKTFEFMAFSWLKMNF